MKVRASDAVPINEFKARASKYTEEFARGRDPIVVTHNGRAAFVALSPSAFDALCERIDFMRAVASGLADAATGEVIDDDDLDAFLDDDSATAERHSAAG